MNHGKPIQTADLLWTDQPALPAGAKLAILVGDLARPGPLAFRVRVPASHRVQPHFHPEDRVYTVISGEFHIGFGDTFDSGKEFVMPTGSVILVPASQRHFQFAGPEGYSIQVNGIGPTATNYVRDSDDPRKSH
jgi:mannose-6-phosphate isomerase-like protein (cupin superfamily)